MYIVFIEVLLALKGSNTVSDFSSDFPEGMSSDYAALEGFLNPPSSLDHEGRVSFQRLHPFTHAVQEAFESKSHPSSMSPGLFLNDIEEALLFLAETLYCQSRTLRSQTDHATCWEHFCTVAKARLREIHQCDEGSGS